MPPRGRPEQAGHGRVIAALRCDEGKTPARAEDPQERFNLRVADGAVGSERHDHEHWQRRCARFQDDDALRHRAADHRVDLKAIAGEWPSSVIENRVAERQRRRSRHGGMPRREVDRLATLRARSRSANPGQRHQRQEPERAVFEAETEQRGERTQIRDLRGT